MAIRISLHRVKEEELGEDAYKNHRRSGCGAFRNRIDNRGTFVRPNFDLREYRKRDYGTFVRQITLQEIPPVTATQGNYYAELAGCGPCPHETKAY